MQSVKSHDTTLAYITNRKIQHFTYYTCNLVGHQTGLFSLHSEFSFVVISSACFSISKHSTSYFNCLHLKKYYTIVFYVVCLPLSMDPDNIIIISFQVLIIPKP